MAESWVFVFGYGIPDLYAEKDDVFVQVWQIYGLTGERETWYITGRDPGGSGCPSCVGQVWGSQSFWRTL